MEFEWVASKTSAQNAGRPLLTLGSPPHQVFQTSISSSTTTATTTTAAAATTPLSSSSFASSSAETHLPLIPSVPVPLITIGKVFAPIPQGRQTILPEAMAAARHLGLAPMLAAALGTASSSPDEFWDIASLTDPLTASNLMQVSSYLGQKRLLFVERGAAERLARGKDEVVLVPENSSKQNLGRKEGRKDAIFEFFKALNPMVAFESVCDALQQGITKAAALDALQIQHQKQDSGSGAPGEDSASSYNTTKTAVPVFSERKTFRIQPTKEAEEQSTSRKKDRKSNEKSTTAAAGAGASPFDSSPLPSQSLFGLNAPDNEIFGPFTRLNGSDNDKTTHPLSPSPSPSSQSTTNQSVNGMAALAHIPVRLALSLLRGASGRFLLLSGKSEEETSSSGSKRKNRKNKIHTEKGATENGKKNNSDGFNYINFEQDPEEYSGADSLDSLQIYFLPKCDFIISSTAGDVRFTPGFLSEAALQKFYKKWFNEKLKDMFIRRRMRRRALYQKLRLAAAIVAGAGGGSTSGGNAFGNGGDGGEDDEDEDGFGDSPDIYEAMQELSEELVPGFDPRPSPILGPSSSSLIRAGATFTTGMITLLSPLMESLGEFKDSAMFFFLRRFDKEIREIDRLNPASRPLGPLLKALASYNATQSAALSLSGTTKNSLDTHSTTAASGVSTANTNSTAVALALAGLCMAVGAKLAGDALTSGPTETINSLNNFRKIEYSSKDDNGSGISGFSVFAGMNGGGWASVAAAAAAAAAQSNGDSKETELTAILRSVLPSLEFNGFTEALPFSGGDEKKMAAVAETVGDVLLKESGYLRVSAEVDLDAEPEQFLDDMKVSTSTEVEKEKEGKKKEEGDEAEEERRPTLGRGLILIGDPGRVLGLRTPRGFSLDGVGIPVGVDDGRRYL